MRKKLLATIVAFGAAVGVLLLPGQASAAPSAATVKAFKNSAQGQCTGTAWWNVNRYASLHGCNPGDPNNDQRWVYDSAALWDTRLRLDGDDRCLTHTASSSFHLLLAPCDGSANQRWNHYGFDGTNFMLKNKATGECMAGYWNKFVEMEACDVNAGRQWWTHLTP